MNNEDLVLSEYLDGELPSDIVVELEKRLARDEVLRKRLEVLRAAALPFPDKSMDLQASGVRVWNKLEWATHGKPSVSPYRRILSVLVRKVSMPIPALAALTLVVGVLGVLVVLRQEPSASGSVAELPLGITEPVVLSGSGTPSLASGIPVSESASGLATSFGSTTSQDSAKQALAVTFEVQNVQELMKILQGQQQIQELKITLPSMKTLSAVGEPEFIRSSELQSGGGKP